MSNQIFKMLVHAKSIGLLICVFMISPVLYAASFEEMYGKELKSVPYAYRVKYANEKGKPWSEATYDERHAFLFAYQRVELQEQNAEKIRKGAEKNAQLTEKRLREAKKFAEERKEYEKQRAEQHKKRIEERKRYEFKKKLQSQKQKIQRLRNTK